MFEAIIGNEPIKELLVNSVINNKISHSYMFIGNEGIGKRLIAKEFAKMILCMNENKYCSNCKSCIEFDSDNNPDFKIIYPDGNSLKIEQIRELQRKVSEKPIISNRKVYIIDDSDKMTVEAQNCLLKTLEEPPEFVTIILVGANENTFLSTIKSRCNIIHFKPLLDDELSKYLRDNYNININSQIMMKSFQGSIGKALELKDKQEDYKRIEQFIYNLENKDKIDILNMIDDIFKSKDEKYQTLDYINIILMDLARKSHKYAKCVQIVENTKQRLKYNANYDMSIDNMILNLWEIVNNKY